MAAGVSDALMGLMRAFPRNFERTPRDEAQATLVLYGQHLDDVPADVLAAAVRRLIRTEEWFPTVARIREACAELLLGLPGEVDALTQVDDRLEWARTRHGAAPPLHPDVRRAVELVGGFHALRTADKPSVVRGQLRNVYRELRGDRLRAAQDGDLAALPPARRPALAPAAVSCER